MESFEPMYAALTELGLSENEQRLYVTSLQNGPSSISDLAKQLGLPRPNLYTLIKNLEEIELVDPLLRERYSRLFTVEPPSKVSELLKEKREKQSKIDRSFVERLPSYLSQYKQGSSPMKIRTLAGQKDFVHVFNQMFEETESELWFCGSVSALSEAVTDRLIQENVSKRLKKGIHIKALLLPSDRDYLTQEQHKKQLRDVRYLESIPEFESSFHIFANKVILWQPKTPMAVLIEDTYLVDMMKNMFTGLWNVGVE